jgi:hypothetical protein
MISNIKIELDYDYTRNPIETTIELNGQTIYSGVLNKNIIEYSFEQDVHDYTLRVYMHNKPTRGTIVDDKGNILKDTFINVKSVEIDRRRFKYVLNDFGKTVFNNGEEKPKNTYISHNGYYELKFTMPIKYFLQKYYNKFNNYKVEDIEKDIEQMDKLLEVLE